MAAGIVTRHARDCRSRDGARCSCSPFYEAWVYLARDRKRVTRSFRDLKEAKGWRADALSAAHKGRLRPPAPKTLREAADEWLDLVESGRLGNRKGEPYKPSTLRGYRRDLEVRILPELGPMRLSDLRRADVQALADELTASGASASSVQNALDPLRVICGRALRRDLIAIDPTEGLELRRPRGRRDRIASPEEASALLEALEPDERALYATALYAGLRRGELRALQWAEIDLEAREIHVRRGWDDEEGEITGKSEAAERTVPIIDRLAAELAAHKLRSRRRGDELVFGRTATDPFVPSTVRSRAHRAWKAGELAEVWKQADPIGLHEARHMFASLMIAAGVNVKALSEFMGHASISITFDIYGHLMPGGVAEARERIDAYLGRPTSGLRRVK